MKRKSKGLMLALFATLAVAAMPVAAAHATQAVFTQPDDEYPVAVTAEVEAGENYVQITGSEGPKMTCESIVAEATLEVATSEIAGTAHFEECEVNIGGSTVSGTVHLNGCGVLIAMGTATESAVHGSIQLTCPEGQKVEVTLGALCQIDVYPQEVGGSVAVTNLENGTVTVAPQTQEQGKYVETKQSIFCPMTNEHTGEDVRIFGAAIVKGYEDLGTHSSTGTPGTSTNTEGAPLDIHVDGV